MMVLLPRAVAQAHLEREDNPHKGESPPQGAYAKWLGDYQYYILATAVCLIFGTYIYLYWDNLSGLLKKDRGDESPLSEGGPSIQSSNPSSGQQAEHYPEGYLRYFSKKNWEMLLEKVKIGQWNYSKIIR
jgi:hypothetical protein